MYTIAQYEAGRATVTTAFGEIAYFEAGDGPPAVFVHGVFLNGYLWRNVIGALKGERRCVAIDLMAHGATRIEPGQDVSLGAQADMLAAFCDALGLDQFDLVANDSGGAIAQLFAVRHPERLRTLTLTNCDVHDELPPANFAGMVEVARQGGLLPVIESMAGDVRMARSNAGLGVGYEDPDSVLDDDSIGAYLAPFADNEQRRRDLERFVASLRGDELVEIEPQLKQLHVPTLVVWGTGDIFFDVKWAYWLRDTIPGVRQVVEFDGAKLFFPDERGAELAAQLKKHWEAVAATA